MEALLVYPEKKKDLQAVKAVLKALNIRFEAKIEPLYGPAFIAEIEQSRKDVAHGKDVKMDIKNLFRVENPTQTSSFFETFYGSVPELNIAEFDMYLTESKNEWERPLF
jgi:hypothetical protein